MIVAIIAGGAGTRLWPLSTPAHPKHLLTIKGTESLTQAAYSRACRLTTTDKIYVVTEVSHAHLIKEQLPDLPDSAFIIEPARRNTSGCFLAVLHHLQDKHPEDEPIAITWADHHVRDVDGFVESFEVAGNASRKYNAPVLVAVEPTYPSVAFGYIHKAEVVPGGDRVHRVATFKEKPDLDLAKRFFLSGEYLWNCGYLVGTRKAFVAAMRKDCPKLWEEYQSLRATKTPKAYKQAYLALENVQLDYVFNELVTNFLVVPGTFDWMDVGSFNDLHDASEVDVDGNCFIGETIATEGVKNAYIRNETSTPVAVIGLENVVVVNTQDGILVARKDLSQKVREVIKQFEV